MSGEINHFDYFSDIEEYFWRKRGAHLLVSPLDWAILETWQKAGIPLQAVLQGIDSAFESYARSKRAAGGRPLKSLAYCVDAVSEAADRWKEAHAGAHTAVPAGTRSAEPFSREELRRFLQMTAGKLRTAADRCRASVAEIARQAENAALILSEMLPLLDVPGVLDLEDFERRLTVVEDKLWAGLQASAEEAVALEARRELDRSLTPYRRKMKPDQIAVLEQQFLRKKLFEAYAFPRLSLFYMA